MQKPAAKNPKAKQVDPLELLKETPLKAVEQITGTGDYANESQDKPQSKEDPVDGKKIQTQDLRIVQGLEAEVEDIRRYKEQEKIRKQRQDLQRIEASERVVSAPIQSAPKPGRRFGGMVAKIKQFAGMSGKEKVKPPSG